MGLQLGNVAPDFTQQSSEGEIHFHEYIDGSWAVLFSHPADFTPVCTTELGQVAKLQAEFTQRGVKVIALSIDSLASHKGWISDINQTQHCTVNFPIIADEDSTVAMLYDMIHPASLDKLTVRTVYIIDPQKRIRLMITYPASTGRNFDEILRVIDSLQLTDNHKVATPVDWRQGQQVVIVPTLTDPEEMHQRFPAGWTEVTPYLRMTPQPK
jgi:thioredoxin-dependent peroxiredoxin